jgi:hypothetical protein
MWKLEHTLEAELTCEQVWSIWTDVNNWSTWDPSVAWAKLVGKFEVGSTFILKPKDGPKVHSVIRQCKPCEGFTNSARLPLCELVFDHRVIEVDGRVKITHGASLTGLTEFIFRRVIGRQIERDIPVAMASLIERVRSMKRETVSQP